MSKCWYCNNELTTGDNPKHFGICNKCYDEMFKSGDVIICSLTNKITELEKQLEEKNADIIALDTDNYSFKQQIDNLRQQLKSQPEEIVEKIRRELGLKLKYKLNDEVYVLKICNQINEVLDTILKDYQK